MNWVAIVVFVLLFGLVTVVGFLAVHWRRADLDLLHEWGLAGRRFGTVISWFLLGGDLYTAYTFVAVPASSRSKRCLSTSCSRVRSAGEMSPSTVQTCTSSAAADRR